jgi:two-component system LytT family response regulator
VSTEPLRVLVVDDEPLARQRIEHLLEEHPDVAIVGTADTGEAAIRAIRDMNPDVVFLDMQMPGGTGLDVAREIGPGFMPVTVFVTAYDEYAVKAFELAATDYLLKPFSDERFAEAFRRARARAEMEGLGEPRDLPGATVQHDAGPAGQDAVASSYLRRIAVQGRGRMKVVPVDDILHIVASGVYAELHTAKETHLVRTPLSQLEEHLDPEQFFRVHRSAIVRLDEVAELIREGGGSCLVQLRSGVKLPVGRSRREELEVRLGRI